MKTPVTERLDPANLPEGYALLDKGPTNTWRYGFLFSWSEAYSTWLDERVAVTVRPEQTVAEAIDARLEGHRMNNAGHDFDLFEPLEN